MKSLIKKQWERLSIVFIVMFLIPQTSMAASGNNKLVAVFDHINEFLTSTLARGVGITAIAAVGYLYLFQNKIDKTRAISIVAAIGIILGASSLYDTVVG